MNNAEERASKFDIFQSALRFAREFFILVGAIALIVYFYPVLGGLRDKLSSGNIEEVSVGMFSLRLKADVATFAPQNITVEAVGGEAVVLEKGSDAVLGEARRRLQSTKGARIDVLLIVPEKTYSGDLLQKYISLLNIRFVVFQSGKTEGWIQASSFTGQLEPHRTYRFTELLQEIVSISHEFVLSSDPARVALEKMQAMRLDNLAVVGADGRFQFMVSMQDILSKVVTSVVLMKS